MASVRPQKQLRHASTSPTCAWTPRNSLAPVASTALSSSPARKSSLTARRVQPWNMKRGRNPDRGKKLFTFSMSPYANTFSCGTNTSLKIRIESFSSIRLDSG